MPPCITAFSVEDCLLKMFVAWIGKKNPAERGLASLGITSSQLYISLLISHLYQFQHKVVHWKSLILIVSFLYICSCHCLVKIFIYHLNVCHSQWFHLFLLLIMKINCIFDLHEIRRHTKFSVHSRQTSPYQDNLKQFSVEVPHDYLCPGDPCMS